MSGNLSLLTVLFIMCYFIKKSRNGVVYTELTRDSNGDYFTNVCNNCYEYGAILNQGVCKCESSGSLFLRSLFLRFEKRCKHEDDFLKDEQCQPWKKELIEVIDTEKKDSEYTFPRKAGQSSCQLEPLISYHNSTVGVWQFFNVSGKNVLALHNHYDPDRFSLIKVTQVSPSLTKFKGYVMKLGLKCNLKEQNKTEESCLIFKAKGKIRFPLNCSSTTVTSTTRSLVTSLTTAIPTSIVTLSSCFACVPTSSPSSTKALTLPSTLVTSPTTAIPTSIVTPSSCFPVPTSSIKECNGTSDPLSPVIIAAIASGVTVLCLLIILVVYRYTYICRPRGLQARNPDHDFDVISNLGPQTYRIQEEPLYAEVQDISPCDKGSGSSTNEGREEGTVLLNPNVYEARFLVPRRTTDPLPSRPELAGNTDTQVHAGAACQNDEREPLGQAAEYSIVLKNPKVVEASSMSLRRSENDFTKLSGAHEQEEESIGDHHHHVVQDDTDNSQVHLECEGTGKDLHYQMLLQSKRAHSAFICPSCNKNPDYQRLSMTQNCPHGTKDIPKQNRESIYQSLSGPEPGSRESVYAPITKEPASEEKGNTNNEENEGLPEYHILEQEEMEVSNEDLTEPVNHDYKELERPEETGDEVDECAKDSVSRDSDQTSEDSDSSIEPSKILNMEDNPAYAKPWKVKEDPELPLEPSDVLNIKNNPAYSTLPPPWTSKTAEPCLRGRAYST